VTAPAVNLDQENILWQPHQGPQTRFLQAMEFEVLYGGAAGGGKSQGLVVDALRQVHKPGYRALILRRVGTDLVEMIDQAHSLYPACGGIYNATERRWYFHFHDRPHLRPTTIEFGYFDKWTDHKRYRGRQFSYIGWDELGDCPEERFLLFLISRCRSGGPGIIPMVRGTANPGGEGHAWLKRRYIKHCGNRGQRIHTESFTYPAAANQQRTVTLTRRFIPSRITDNPTLIENNPAYMAQLMSLPITMRKQLLEGDWSAGEGMAFEELSRDVHLVKNFIVPKHWPVYAGFDWGYAHPWAFGVFTTNEDGRLYCVDTIWGRRLKDSDIVDRIATNLPEGITKERLTYTAAGHDCWSEIKARSEHGPTTAERFVEGGVPLKRANISRSDGFKQLLHLLAWRDQDGNQEKEPDLVFLDTPGNQRLFEQLEGLVTDPDHTADVLKIDADPLTGEGGDDGYDMLRYAAMERPKPAPSTYATERVRAFDPAVLAAEHERVRKGKPTPERKRKTSYDPTTYFGGQ
jgi:hypothetical protein